jgi:hypothetical protein
MTSLFRNINRKSTNYALLSRAQEWNPLSLYLNWSRKISVCAIYILLVILSTGLKNRLESLKKESLPFLDHQASISTLVDDKGVCSEVGKDFDSTNQLSRNMTTGIATYMTTAMPTEMTTEMTTDIATDMTTDMTTEMTPSKDDLARHQEKLADMTKSLMEKVMQSSLLGDPQYIDTVK